MKTKKLMQQDKETEKEYLLVDSNIIVIFYNLYCLFSFLNLTPNDVIDNLTNNAITVPLE
jgi:hypothetical protein